MNFSSYNKYINYFLILILPFTVYFLTHPPTVGLNDSGLLAAASYDLGTPIPTGFPAYTIISHLIVTLPLGSVSDRFYLTSALASVGIILFIFLIVQETLKDKNKFYAELSGLLACLSLAFSYEFWSSSINIETTTFTNLAIFSSLYFLIRIKRNSDIKNPINPNRSILFIYTFFISLGVGVGLNPVFIALMPVIAVFIYLNRQEVIKYKTPYILGTILSVFIFIFEYGFLILSAQNHPFVNFGDPHNLSSLLKLITGSGFLSKPTQVTQNVVGISGFSFLPDVVAQSLSNYIRMFLYEFNPLLIPLTLIGFNNIFKKKFIFLSLLLLFASNAFLSIFYISGNQEYWQLTSWIVLAITIGTGFYYLLEFLDEQKRFRNLFMGKPVPLYIIVILISLFPLIFWYGKLNRSNMTFTKDYIDNLYMNVPNKSIVIGGGNVFEGLSEYNREVAQYRRDIIPVAGNLFYDFSWYRDNISKATGLNVSQNTNSTVLKYSKNMQGNIILSIVKDNPSKTVYITGDYVTTYLNDINSSCSKGICKLGNYILLPHGLLYEVIPADFKGSVNLNNYDYIFSNGLPTKYFFLEQYYNLELKSIVGNYLESYVTLGDYYSVKGDVRQALYFYKKAQSLNDGTNPDPIIRLAVTYQNLGDPYLAQLYYEEAIDLTPDNLELRNSYYSMLSKLENTSTQNSTSPTAQPQQTQNKQYISTNGVSFVYPGNWLVSEISGKISVVNDKNNFFVKINVVPYLPNDINSFIQAQTDTYGQILEQGKALIPNFKTTFVRIWQQNNVKKDQFFLFSGNKVVKVMVYPSSDNNLMQQFNIILGSLKVK